MSLGPARPEAGTAASVAARSAAPPGWRLRRSMLWAALVALLLVAQTLLLALTLNYETSRAQETTDAVATEVAAEVRRQLTALQQQLHALGTPLEGQGSAPAAAAPATWRHEAQALLRERRALMRIEWRGADGAVAEAVDTPYLAPVFALLGRGAADGETLAACAAAERARAPAFSRSYFVPMAGGLGLEMVDLCLPQPGDPARAGSVVATIALAPLLEASLTPAQARSHEITFTEGDGTRLARAGVPRGAGIFRAERLVDLSGATLQLRADSAAGAPQLIPNLSTALVLGLSLALFALVLLLARDVRRRAAAERALADALALRKAMDDALVTGLRARTLDGRISYVNPAFCAMVGYSSAELMAAEEPPYWPPERRDEYRARLAARRAGHDATLDEALREGVETEFMRKGGERFPVMVYEAPLVDPRGRASGWMSAVLDISAQRRIEELSRQQQERLQATARLATVGEMASLLSHELNQPLAAISSYASGSLNLLQPAAGGASPPAEEMGALLRQALERIAEQAERAGRVIKSVHDFVRRREQQHETVGADQLVDAVLPLVRLQARKSGTRVEVELPQPAPRVRCDRTMVEQVLLNLTRNGIQAMESATPLAARELTIRVGRADARGVVFGVEDAGPGIEPEVAARLFTPFYTTRRDGMGLGLSLCRTVVEQHGGVLDFETAPGRGTTFRFTLPAAPQPAAADAGAPAPAAAPTSGAPG
ncbi:MAG: PAS domain S-box protein [Burkholderiales bacterium]|nr:PAS domain S-box protein [Burkholderiales bacterium]